MNNIIMRFGKKINPITKLTPNSAIIPSHAVFGIFLSQCFPKLTPTNDAVKSPKIVINNATRAISKSKTENAMIVPRRK